MKSESEFFETEEEKKRQVCMWIRIRTPEHSFQLDEEELVFLSASIASRFYISIFPTGYYLSFPRHFYQFKTFLNKSQHSIQNYFEHFRTFIEVTWFQINFESYVSKLIWISKLKIGHNLFVLIKLALLDWKPFQSCFP